MSKRAVDKALEYEKSLDYYHYTSDNPSVAYQKGYEQAEKDTIERMVEWLKVHAKDYIVNMTGSYPDAPFNAIIGGKCWDELKKAMEKE